MRASRAFSALHQHDLAIGILETALERIQPTDDKKISELTSLRDSAIIAKYEFQREQSARINHITKLPVELLLHIFALNVHSLSVSPVILSHVSSVWREIIWNSRSLWSSLTLTDRKPIAKATFWVKRSQGIIKLLRISLEGGLDQVLALLVNPDALESIHLTIPETASQRFRHSAQYLVQNIAAKPYEFHVNGGITELDFHLQQEGIQGTLALDSGVLSPERLKKLSLVYASFPWTIERVTNLVSLELSACIIDPDFLIPLLEQSPLLEKLDVRSIEPVWTSNRRTRLLLPNLTILKVVNDVFLNMLEVPALQVLHVSLIAFSDCFGQLSPPNPPLVELCVSECTRASEARIPTPKTLQRLHITKMDMKIGDFLDSLCIPDPIGELPCPMLQDVDVSYTSVTDSSIIRLIKALNGTEVIGGGLKSLKMDICPGVNSDSLPWIRSKVPLVSCVYERVRKKRK